MRRRPPLRLRPTRPPIRSPVRRLAPWPAAALACALLAARSAPAAELLLSPESAIAAGSSVRMELLVTNDGSTPMQYGVREALRARLVANDQAFQVDLERAPDAAVGEITIPPQGFVRIVYRLRVPPDVRGTVTARVLEGEARAVMFEVLPAEEVAQPAALAQPAAATAAASAPVAPLTRESAFAAALSAYEPVYFSFGAHEDANAKFQLSLKFRLFNRDAGLARRVPALGNLYLGYTQTSLWDMESRSNPFRDTSYKPRLFYVDTDVWHAENTPFRLSAELGLGHESNGRGGDESRSINIAYLRPGLIFGRTGKWQATFAPMIYSYLEREDNRDIASYRGHVDWSASVGKADSWQLSGMLREGSGEGWSLQMDLSYPLRSIALGNLNGYLHFQYFGGWGESLLDYDRRLPAQYRIGLMIVR